MNNSHTTLSEVQQIVTAIDCCIIIFRNILLFAFRNIFSEYCSLVVKVSFVLFFWKFCVGFEVNFMFELVIYINMVEKVSSLPKYYVCIRHACTACMSLQKED